MDATPVNDSLLPVTTTQALLPAPKLTVPLPPQTAVTAIPRGLGTVEVLSEVEQAKLQACEAVMALGWTSFLEVGDALAQIRDGRLYRCEFESFEAYCRLKWEYSRRQIDRFISAAQVVTQLRPNWSQCMPANESQLRILIGLTAEEARQTWQRALEMARGRRFSARLVKSALKELRFTGQTSAVARPPRPSKAEQRQLVDNTIGELLMLVSQNAARDILTEKIEALHHQIRSVFESSRSRTRKG
jgi:hypothetical protein